MDRSTKEATIDELRTELGQHYSVIVFRPQGLTVAEDRALRQKAIAAQTRMRVIKNTLAKRAVDGTQFAGLAAHFKGPTALIYSNDAVAPAKVIAEFAKTSKKVEIVGGALGEQMLDARGAAALASLPSLNELRAKLVGMLQTPATRIATVLKEPAGQLARVLAAKAKT
jgi:large subunit ribosomal protein L10